MAQHFGLDTASHVWFSYENGVANVPEIEITALSLMASIESADARVGSEHTMNARVVPVPGIRDQIHDAALAVGDPLRTAGRPADRLSGRMERHAGIGPRPPLVIPWMPILAAFALVSLLGVWIAA